MIERTCGHCGTTYQTYPSIKPRYCSSKCAGAAKKNGQDAQCLQCGKSIYVRPSEARARNRRFCSKSCAMTARNLTEANPSYQRDLSGEHNPMFGKGRSGADNPMFGKRLHLAPRWKGGRKVRKDGYVFVVAPDDHPYPSYTSVSGTKYILEHRLLMEQHIGRYLRPEEVVHHRDEDSGHNIIENLELYADQAEHMRLGHGAEPPSA